MKNKNYTREVITLKWYINKSLLTIKCLESNISLSIVECQWEKHVNGYRWDIDFDCKLRNIEYLFSSYFAIGTLCVLLTSSALYLLFFFCMINKSQCWKTSLYEPRLTLTRSRLSYFDVLAKATMQIKSSSTVVCTNRYGMLSIRLWFLAAKTEQQQKKYKHSTRQEDEELNKLAT